MNDFPATIKSKDIESARAEVLQYYQEFCTDNAVLAEIEEATSVEALAKICCFMNGLSIFLRKTDIVRNADEYAIGFRVAADESEIE